MKRMCIWLAGMMAAVAMGAARPPERPNVVLILLDDSGWSDFQPFGNPPYETPNVNKLAEAGCRYNRFFVPQGVCSASRSALMTGCYPGRTKMFGAHGPNERGLEPVFSTMSEVFKGAGYQTGWFGKWHLGDQPETRPDARGFDETAGLMYSNDMWAFHPTNPEYWGRFPLQYRSNGEVTCERVTPEFQKTLTWRVTQRSVDFINRHKDAPFFLYVAHPMPHVPLFCSEAFAGKSGAGLYGDVILELDDSIGQIMTALKKNGLEENTIVIFTSDNGPWAGYGNHAGKTPFREFKATGFNGGTQSACIIKYPGKIKEGSTSDDLFNSIDLLPTLCGLTDIALPENEIDGEDVWALISGEAKAKNSHVYYPFSTGKVFEGIMTGDGRWKLHLPHGYRHVVEYGKDGMDGKYEKLHIGLSLFDLQADPHEKNNIISEHPEVAEKLQKLAAEHKARFYE